MRAGSKEPPSQASSGRLLESVGAPHCGAPTSGVYFLLEDDGRVHLAAVSVDDGSVSRPIAGQRRVDAAAVGPDGTVVALVSEPRLPAELFVIDASASSGLRRLTHVNEELLKTIALSDAWS